VGAGVDRPSEDCKLMRGVFSLFSCGDECVLVVSGDGREERRELAWPFLRNADGGGESWTPNSFSDGGGARGRPKVDHSPRRSMKLRPPPGEVLLEEQFDGLAFSGSGSPLAECPDDVFGC